jgi:hypothetical protein
MCDWNPLVIRDLHHHRGFERVAFQTRLASSGYEVDDLLGWRSGGIDSCGSKGRIGAGDYERERKKKKANRRTQDQGRRSKDDPLSPVRCAKAVRID